MLRYRLLLALACALVACDDDPDVVDAGLVADMRAPVGRDMRPPDLDPPDQTPPDAGDPDGGDLGPDASLGPACANDLDDDGDGLTDLADPGCLDPTDDDEADPADPPLCANGVDDDDDGLVDWPDDPDCTGAGGQEGAACGALEVTPLVEGPANSLRLFRRPAVAEASCATGATEAAVGAITVEGPAVVRISVDSPRPVVFFARTRCRDRLTERACALAGTPNPDVAEIEVEGTETLYVLVQPLAMLEAALDVDVQIEVTPVPDTCRNGLDDDGDGKIDQADPGCADANDADETDPEVLPECANGLDDDGDGATDWPDDPECQAASGRREGIACGGIAADELGLGEHRLSYTFDSADDGVTRGACGGQGDEALALLVVDRPASLVADISTPVAGNIATYLRSDCRDRETEAVCDAAFTRRQIVVDRLEPGTWFLFFDHDVGFEQRTDDVEAEITLTALPRRACENGLDDDGDGAIDLADPGCARAGDDDESDPAAPPSCADGLDNDGDGAIDYPLDLECLAAGSAAEGSGCAPGAPIIPVGDAGGRFVVDARPLAPSAAIADCDGDLGAETVFALTLTTDADVRVSVGAEQHRNTRIWLRTTCDDFESERACAERDIALDDLRPGTYYVFVEFGEAQRQGPPPTVDFEVLSHIVACNDRVDNDGDGAIDLADPGCTHGRDTSEADPPAPPACADGLDNDGDGFTDYPDDPQCAAAGVDDEALVCRFGVEVTPVGPEGGRYAVDADGPGGVEVCDEPALFDERVFVLDLDERSRVTLRPEGLMSLSVRAQCTLPESAVACEVDARPVEVDLDAGVWYVVAASLGIDAALGIEVQSLVTQCNDAIDNDGDGRLDAADPGCAFEFDDDETDPDERPACADGVDNDDDGLVDHPDDPECRYAGGTREDDLCPAVEDEVIVPPIGGVFELATGNGEALFVGDCGGRGGGLEGVLVVQLDAPARVTAEVIAASFDTLMYIRPSCDADAVDVECDDDDGDGNFALVSAELEAGTWMIIVDGFRGADGDATVRVDIEPRDAEAP